jgi:spore coat protein U-like protein
MKTNLKNFSFISALIAGFITMQPAPALAGTATGNFQATAILAATCQTFATNINFSGFYPAANGNATATGTVTVICTNGSPYTLSLNSGASGNFGSRTMKGQTSGNTDLLNYNIYTTSGYTNVFGDGTGGTSQLSGTGNGTSQFYTMYATSPLNQYITPDNYLDTLTVTLSY